QRAYQRFPDYVALIDDRKAVTYRELYFRAILLSQRFLALGVKPGDRVFIYAENSCEFFVAYFAILHVGAVLVPINIFLHVKELAFIVNDAQPHAIFVTSSLRGNIDALVEHNLVPALPHILTENDIDWTMAVPRLVEERFPHFTIKESGPDELSVLLYTSGTTGVPKGVMLSSRIIIANLEQTATRFMLCGLAKKERVFCVLPLFHAFAQHTCIWLPMVMGSAVIVIQKIERKLILDGLKHKPTVFFGFPALFGLLCIMKTAPLDTIKLFVSGADMLPDKIRIAFAMVYGRKICSGYGLTEAAPVVAVNHQNFDAATNVVGRPLLGINYKICDERGNLVKDGQIGLLWISGGNIMLGYYKAESATEQILRDGWLNTGDLATIDSTGMLAIQGRVKDVIIHKGFNIYPAEVENILLKYPSVIKAAVIGRDEPMAGQVPIAFVATRVPEEGLEDRLRELCAHNLAAYKIPRKFICLEDLPLNATGKVDKKKLSHFQ
ncbi:MAG: AMP-binding protein, partial [Candidatus Babeliales bacterium]